MNLRINGRVVSEIEHQANTIREDRGRNITWQFNRASLNGGVNGDITCKLQQKWIKLHGPKLIR